MSKIPGQVFSNKINYLILVLIVISMFILGAGTVPTLTPEQKKIIDYFEYFIIGFFTCEYLLRIYLSPDKKKYLFSFFGIIDFLAVVPFYLTLSFNVSAIRALRLLRVFQLLKLFRFEKAMNRLSSAFTFARQELALFIFTAMIIMYIAAVGIYFFENAAQPQNFSSIFQSLWWAVATLTTVGYGDIFPITVPGKIFTFLILMVGLGIVSIPSGIIASALTKARHEEEQRKEREE